VGPDEKHVRAGFAVTAPRTEAPEAVPSIQKENPAGRSNESGGDAENDLGPRSVAQPRAPFTTEQVLPPARPGSKLASPRQAVVAVILDD
jgi:hypothetical protein